MVDRACNAPPDGGLSERAGSRNPLFDRRSTIPTPLILAALASIAYAEVLEGPVTSPDEPLRVGLVIGLDGRIGGSGDLTAAESDARDLAWTLHEGGFQRVVLLTGPDATGEGVRAELDALDRLGLGSDDTVLVHMVTHGASCPLTGDRRTQHLRLVETFTDERCWSEDITDYELLTGLQHSGAGHRILIIDACFTAYKAAGGPDLGQRDPWAGRRYQEVVLRSTGAGLEAFQVGDHVLFTGALVEALQDLAADADADGAVTAEEAWDWVATRVRDQLPMRQETILGKVQNLVLVGVPSEPRVPVLRGLPDQHRWAIGKDPISLGATGTAPIRGDGPLETEDALGSSLRVRGVPRSPGYHDARTWVSGRVRGWPTFGVEGGVLLPRGSDVLPLARPGPTTVSVRLHEQVLPEVGIAVDASLAPLTWQVAAVVDGELHVRSWTFAAGARGGLLNLAGDGSEAVVPGPAIAIGGEVGLRKGLGRSLAGTLTVAEDLTRYDDESGEGFPVGITALRLGVLWDPNVAAGARSAREGDAARQAPEGQGTTPSE